jgi:hypothetical protein
MQLGKLNRKTGTATEAFVGKGGGAIFMGATCLYPHTGPFDMKFMQNDRRHFLAFDTPHVGTDTAAHGVTLSSHAQRLFSL